MNIIPRISINDDSGPEAASPRTAGTTAWAKVADAHLKWERIFQGQASGWPVSLDSRRRKRVLVKIIGE